MRFGMDAVWGRTNSYCNRTFGCARPEAEAGQLSLPGILSAMSTGLGLPVGEACSNPGTRALVPWLCQCPSLAAETSWPAATWSLLSTKPSPSSPQKGTCSGPRARSCKCPTVACADSSGLQRARDNPTSRSTRAPVQSNTTSMLEWESRAFPETGIENWRHTSDPSLRHALRIRTRSCRGRHAHACRQCKAIDNAGVYRGKQLTISSQTARAGFGIQGSSVLITHSETAGSGQTLPSQRGESTTWSCMQQQQARRHETKWNVRSGRTRTVKDGSTNSPAFCPSAKPAPGIAGLRLAGHLSKPVFFTPVTTAHKEHRPACTVASPLTAFA